MVLDREYTVNPIEDRNENHAILSSSALEILRTVNDILCKGLEGIHLIGGLTGSGKTSVLNMAKQEQGHSKKYISLSIVDDTFDLVSELVIKLRKLFSESKLITEQDIREKLLSLEVRMGYQIQIKQGFEIENCQINKKAEKYTLASKVVDFFYGAAEFQNEHEQMNNEKSRIELISTPAQQEERNLQEILEIFKKITLTTPIIVIFEEVDKLTNIEMETFLKKYKRLFLESGLICFWVCNAEQYINVRYFGKNKDLFNQFIYVPALTWNEYLLVSPKIKEEVSWDYLRKSYFYTLGNLRTLVVFNDNSIEFPYAKELWDTLIEIENTSYYKTLPEVFQDVVKLFVKNILGEMRINTSLTNAEMLSVLSENVFNTKVERIFQRVIVLLKNAKYIEEVESDCFGLALDNHIYNLNEHREYEAEVVRLFSEKNRLLGIHTYDIEYLKTTNVDDLKRLIQMFISEIDAIFLYEQTNLQETIFHTSYCAVILAHTLSGCTAFVNTDGFSWNYEAINAYKELKVDLESKNICYKEMQLEGGKKVTDVYRKGENIKIDLYKEFIEE